MKLWQNQSQKIIAAVVVLLCGVTGGYLVVGSHAITPTASKETEGGTVQSPANIISDTTASGGQAAKFGNGSTGTGTTITIAAAGDIGVDPGTNDTKVANAISGDNSIQYVLALGDLAYPSGTQAQFAYYNNTWGAFKAKTYPAVGNHEFYGTANGQGYSDYWKNNSPWGSTPKPPAVVTTALNAGRFYYSYDLGSWHLIALDSAYAAHDSGSAQMTWLKNDLAATNKPCVLAYAHHPFMNTSSAGGVNSDIKPFITTLYNAHADLYLAGHEHDYSSWKKLTPSSTVDSAAGIRPFVIGTGGTGTTNQQVTTNAGLSKALGGTNGYVKFQLKPDGYTWNFYNPSGSSLDSGSGTCNAK